MFDTMGVLTMVDRMKGINHSAWKGDLPVEAAFARTSTPVSPSQVMHFVIFHPLLLELVALTSNPMPDE
jgi:hypothetical protein